MSLPIASPLESAKQVLLCWCDAPDSPSREQVAQVLESHASEALIRSTMIVQEKTPVRLIGEQYTGNGIVCSCKEVQNGFMLTVRIIGRSTSASGTTLSLPDRDPGVLAVENFLTEEQEAEILREIEAEEC